MQTFWGKVTQLWVIWGFLLVLWRFLLLTCKHHIYYIYFRFFQITVHFWKYSTSIFLKLSLQIVETKQKRKKEKKSSIQIIQEHVQFFPGIKQTELSKSSNYLMVPYSLVLLSTPPLPIFILPSQYHRCFSVCLLLFWAQHTDFFKIQFRSLCVCCTIKSLI